jgi:ABC-type branched-subunit amino acid transport system substrate-binding protein
MRGRRASEFALLLAAIAAYGQQTPPRPYHDLRNAPRAYNGPGREDPDPAAVKEVLIGYFGPADAAHFEGGSMWQGTTLAIEEANAAGGYRGASFRLMPEWTENPWKGGVGRLARLVYTERVWALIGGIDGAGTHLAEQVVAKALLTLVNPAAGDRSIHTANVPWTFTCVPSDQLQARVLSEAVRRRGGPFVLLSATDHDSRAFAVQLETAFKASGIAPAFHVEFEAGTLRAADLAGRAAGLGADCAVLIAGSRDTARVLKALREAGFGGALYTGPALARSAALAEAGPAAEGAFFPLVTQETAAAGKFRDAFTKRFGAGPDWAAAQAYDAANLLLAAIRKAGLNRARIRDAVQELSPWEGASGPIHWDELGQNDRAVRLGVIRHGVPAQATPDPNRPLPPRARLSPRGESPGASRLSTGD